MYIFVHFLTHIWMWNLTRYAVDVFKRQSTVMMLCEQYNIRGVKSYLNEDYLAFMQMLLHIFFISLWKQSKAQRPFFVHFFGARQWLWWGSSAYLINTYISRRKIQQCHVALRNHVALENVQSGRVPTV